MPFLPVDDGCAHDDGDASSATPPLQLSTENLKALDRLTDPSTSSAMTVEKVLVIGAGELGLAVLEALSHHPLRKQRAVHLSVLLPQATLDSAAPHKKRLTQHLRALGVELEAADIAGAETPELALALAGFDTVVSCAGTGMPAGTQRRLLDAVRAAGVRRYFPWQFGIDYDAVVDGGEDAQELFGEQLAVRKALRAQTELDWVIVTTGLFMDFLFSADFGIVDLEARTARALGAWQNRITATTSRDIGRVTAELVLDPREVHSQVVYVAGETISYEALAVAVEEETAQKKTEAATETGAAAGAEMENRPAPAPMCRELWDAEVLARQRAEDPDSIMVKYRETFARGRGVAWGPQNTVNAERGVAMTDIRSHLRTMLKRS